MGGRGIFFWLKFSLGAAAAAGCACLFAGRALFPERPASDIAAFTVLAMTASWWLGALVGGAVDRVRYGRRFTEPMFPGRFGWFYARKFWQRFAIVFSASWLAFVTMAVTAALVLGETEEAAAFFTIEGAAAVTLFVVVFGVEGAVVGGLVDLVRLMAGGRGTGSPPT